jgi:hypothetical protein
MRGAAEKSYRTQFQQQLGLQFGISGAGGNDGGADRPQPLLEQQPGRHQMVRPGVERDVAATNAGGFEYHVHAVSGRIIDMGRFKDRAGRDEDVAQFAEIAGQEAGEWRIGRLQFEQPLLLQHRQPVEVRLTGEIGGRKPGLAETLRQRRRVADGAGIRPRVCVQSVRSSVIPASASCGDNA